MCIADVTGYNVWIPSSQDEFQKKRRDFLALPVLPKWKLAIRTLFDSTKPSSITLSRSRSASSAGSNSQSMPTFSQSETPYIEVGSAGLTYVAAISNETSALASSATLWFGVKYTAAGADSVVWFGQNPASVKGTSVSGDWDRRVLSVAVGQTACAVTSYRVSDTKLRFDVLFKVPSDRIGALIGAFQDAWAALTCGRRPKVQASRRPLASTRFSLRTGHSTGKDPLGSPKSLAPALERPCS